jgi:hypothetical protein
VHHVLNLPLAGIYKAKWQRADGLASVVVQAPLLAGLVAGGTAGADALTIPG